MKRNSLLIVALLFSACVKEKINPPLAQKQPYTYNVGGKQFLDDFHWMTDKESNNQQTLAYVKEENIYADKILAPTQQLQKELYHEMVQKMSEDDADVPTLKDGFYYYWKEEKGAQYGLYCRKQGSLEASEEILLNMNTLAKPFSYYNIDDIAVSSDGNYLAYTYDSTGAEVNRLAVKDLSSGNLLPDTALKVQGLTWANDNKTLFYVTMDENDEWSHLVWRKTLGKKDDVLVFREKDNRWTCDISKTKDKKYLLITAGTDDVSEVWYLAANNPTGEFKCIAPRNKNFDYSAVHHEQDFFFLTSKDNCPNNKLMFASETSPQPEFWKPFIAYRDSVQILSCETFQDFLVLTEMVNALPRIEIYYFKTKELKVVKFPEAAYDLTSLGNPMYDSSTCRIVFDSMLTPAITYDLYLNTLKLEQKKQREVKGYDKNKYESKRLYAKVRDGEEVPVSLFYNRELFKHDGSNPLYIYAYGSYGENSMPYFSGTRCSLADRGFVYAIAHVRGGQEKGREWFENGRLLHKINTYNDMVDCIKYLQAEKYGTKTVIEGASAGGMLVTGVANMAPELLTCVIAEVPAVDEYNQMLDPAWPGVTYHFGQWGNPQIPEQNEAMLKWDTYQNVKSQNYPAILVTAGVNDPRVPYWQPVKYVAKMRSLKTDANFLLLRTETAGHGGASGRYDYLKSIAEEYAFAIYCVEGLWK